MTPTSLNDLNEKKDVSSTKDTQEIDKRIRSLWYPPFEGAFIVISGKKYYLIDQYILNEYGELYNQYKAECGGNN